MKSTDYRSLTQAKEYYRNRFGKGLGKVSQDELELISNWLSSFGNLHTKTFLDIGTGTGRIMPVLLDSRPRGVYALDQSQAMLSFFKKKYCKKITDKTIQTLIGRSDNIPLPSERIDLVTSLHLFKHLPVIDSTLTEIARVLKKDGYLVFDVLNRDSLIWLNIGTCYTISLTKLKTKLKNQGFKVKKIHFLHPLGETIYRFTDIVGVGIISHIEQVLTSSGLKIGTKIFVLAQKT